METRRYEDVGILSVSDAITLLPKTLIRKQSWKFTRYLKSEKRENSLECFTPESQISEVI